MRGSLGKSLAVVALLLVALLVAAACRTSGRAGSHGAVVTIDLADSGRTITLHVGDRLRLRSGAPSQQHWVLVGFPRELVSRELSGSGTGFSFTARARGVGRIEAVNTLACPSGLPRECSVPEAGNLPGGTQRAGQVPRSFAATIRVA